MSMAEGGGSSTQAEELVLRSPHKVRRSPHNSSPVNPEGNITNNLHKLDLTSASWRQLWHRPQLP